MLGLTESSCRMNFCWCTGDMISGVELSCIVLSVNLMANRRDIDVAGAERILFVGLISAILSIGYIFGLKKS